MMNFEVITQAREVHLYIKWPGGSDDWAKGGAGVKFSYTVELPDTGKHGFILPAQ